MVVLLDKGYRAVELLCGGSRKEQQSDNGLPIVVKATVSKECVD